eukprot:TRINITY_DN4419_c0_g1_i4.p1 TRINITY_DN4419_c0_g1~~TRINITY_DN4419_c0_g1_i4.p1  ORF type:complete len:100 (-),score=9.24 TRINITY_DN4419_c0_g1_i4:448-747(-)
MKQWYQRRVRGRPKGSKQNNHPTTGSNLALLDDAIGTIVRSALRSQAFKFCSQIKQLKITITSLTAQIASLQASPKLALAPTLCSPSPPISWSLNAPIP